MCKRSVKYHWGNLKMTLKVVKGKLVTTNTDTDTAFHQQWSHAILTPSPSEDNKARLQKKEEAMFFAPVGKDQLKGQHQVPDSAPAASTSTPDAFRDSADLTPKALNRKINSTPVAGRVTKRFLEENGYPAPLSEMANFNFETEMQGPRTAGMSTEAMYHGGLYPTKIGTFGTHPNVQVKEGMNRVMSQQGIVENVDEEQHGETVSSETEHTSGRSIVTNPYAGENPPPISHPAFAYTMNAYTGTWENNPAVVSCLSKTSIETYSIANRAILFHRLVQLFTSRNVGILNTLVLESNRRVEIHRGALIVPKSLSRLGTFQIRTRFSNFNHKA